MIKLASFGHHHGFGFHHYAGMGWMGHIIVSSILHAMIFHLVFRGMSHLSFGEGVLLVVAVIGAVYWFNRRRPYRRW